MALSFSAGASIVGLIAAFLLWSVLALGTAIILAGVTAASVPATMNALYTGDSATRRTVLVQLDQSFKSQTNQAIDPKLTELLLPAIERCESDADPEVGELARDLAEYLREHTAEQK